MSAEFVIEWMDVQYGQPHFMFLAAFLEPVERLIFLAQTQMNDGEAGGRGISRAAVKLREHAARTAAVSGESKHLPHRGQDVRPVAAEGASFLQHCQSLSETSHQRVATAHAAIRAVIRRI